MSRALIVAIAAAAVLAAVAALEWYSSVAGGIASGGPVPLQSIAPRPPFHSSAPRAPLQRAVPAPSTSSVIPSPTPVAVRVQTPAPTGGPTIVSVALSTQVASGGQVVTGTVATSADVTGVQASIAGYASALTKVSPGYFALSYRVPQLPPFFHRTYTIEIVAQNARGQSATSSLPITIR